MQIAELAVFDPISFSQIRQHTLWLSTCLYQNLLTMVKDPSVTNLCETVTVYCVYYQHAPGSRRGYGTPRELRL